MRENGPGARERGGEDDRALRRGNVRETTNTGLGLTKALDEQKMKIDKL